LGQPTILYTTSNTPCITCLYFTFWDRQFGTQDPNYECLMTDAKPDINA